MTTVSVVNSYPSPHIVTTMFFFVIRNFRIYSLRTLGSILLGSYSLSTVSPSSVNYSHHTVLTLLRRSRYFTPKRSPDLLHPAQQASEEGTWYQ